MSKIEQIITEIEEYIDGCKFKPLSSSVNMVNKDEIDEMLAELRLRTHDEIKKYQKIIANKDAILNDAKERAENMVAEATAHINQLVSEHEIMQQAYKEANSIIESAQKQAQEMLDSATNEANSVRMNAMQYTDDILNNVQGILTTGMNNFQNIQDTMMNALNGSLDVVVESRRELSGEEPEPQAPEVADDVDDYTVDLDK